MSHFVKLHEVGPDTDRTPTDVWINLDRVAALSPTPDGSTMIAFGDSHVLVTESAESICRVAAGGR